MPLRPIGMEGSTQAIEHLSMIVEEGRYRDHVLALDRYLYLQEGSVPVLRDFGDCRNGPSLKFSHP